MKARITVLGIFFLGLSLASLAQGFLNRVPLKNVSTVLTINAHRMESKMSLKDIHQIPFIQKLIKETKDPDSLAFLNMDIGFEWNKQSVFFIEHTDTATLSCFVFSVSDKEKFKKFHDKNDSIRTDVYGNYYVEGYRDVLMWNDKMGVFVTSEVEDEMRASDDDYTYAAPFDTAVSYDEAPADIFVDTMALPPRAPRFNDTDTIAYIADEDEDDDYDPFYYEELAPGYSLIDVPSEEANNEPYFEFHDHLSLRQSMVQAQKILAGENSASILQNPRFAKHLHPHADMVLWIGMEKDYFLKVLKKSLGSYFYQYAMPVNSPVFNENNFLVTTLIFGENQIKVSSKTYLDKRVANRYHRIYNARLDRRLIRNVKGDQLLGFVSSAMSTRALLNEMPEIWKDYLRILPYTNDIADEIMDLFFLLIDEKAISKVMNGEMLAACTGISQKEISYTTYEYDSSYSLVPVVKTRQQAIPEFVWMYATSDAASNKKFFSIFKKKGLLQYNSKYQYYSAGPFPGSMPFTLYVVIRKKAVYICNSEEQLNILIGKSKRKPVSRQYANLMRKNSFAFVADVKQILSSIKSAEEGVSDPDWFLAQKYSGLVEITGKGKKRKAFATDVSVSTPNEHSNSLHALVHLFSDLTERDSEKKSYAEPVIPAVSIDGTRSMLRATELVLESYNDEHPDKVVHLDDYGTGSAMKDFTGGYLDVVQAVRPISFQEDSLCKANKVEYIELPVAYESLAFIVNAENTWAADITVEELKKIWGLQGKDKITHWNQIRSQWPKEPILLYASGKSSSDYAFMASQLGTDLKLRDDYTKEYDGELLANWVGKKKYALGVVRYSSYLAAKTKIKILKIDDQVSTNGKGAIALSEETIQNTQYKPFSRVLYWYIKKPDVEKAQLEAWVSYYLENIEDVLNKAECLPLESSTYLLVKKRWESRKTGSVWLSLPKKGNQTLKELYKE
ncbi:MAG: substrate-binding domain-containing protein [Cytophagaceae bacterium]|nr:substrate-binding domain-containing protein [Cytophagaceae bacterium]